MNCNNLGRQDNNLGGPRPLLGDPYYGDQNERGDNWGRPTPYGGPHPPHNEMRYNWHRMDYHQPRRTSFDDEGSVT